MRGLQSTLTLLAGLFLCGSAVAVAGPGQNQSSLTPAASPAVVMSVTLPDGHSQQLTTHESGLATVTVGGREYGFRPTMHDDLGNAMTITVFDMGSSSEAVREIGTVDLKGGGPAVSTRTTPAFKVQAHRAPRNATT